MKLNCIEDLFDKDFVKGFKKEIKRWLKPFKKKIAIEMSVRNECVISKPKIYVDVVRDLKTDNKIDTLHKKLYEESDYQFMTSLDFYTFAFLHELGHIMTVRPKDVLEEKEQHDEEFQLAILEHFHETGENPSLETATKYYMNTTFERKANEWAYKFWQLNKDYCKELEDVLIRYSVENI